MAESKTTLEVVESITVIISALIAAISLGITAYQTYRNTKQNRATFWLELRKMFALHDEVHLKLRNRGEWHNSSTKLTPEQLFKVEAYMGLFEHCKYMLDDKLIDWNTFSKIYGYRVANILTNSYIVKAKLIENKDGWKDFILLAEKLGKQYTKQGAKIKELLERMESLR